MNREDRASGDRLLMDFEKRENQGMVILHYSGVPVVCLSATARGVVCNTGC
jgi:hypothetical protein